MREIPFGKPLIDEAEKRAVEKVLGTPMLVHGPKTKEFETDFAAFTGAPYSVSLASCTAGLHLAYFDLGVGEGDEVIVPAQTHTATAHAVEFCGAECVFVDCELETGNIDIEQIEKAISEKTRAISVVHFLGMPVDMDRVNAIASKYDLFVLEDCALSLGGTYKGVHTGLHGDAGTFSFYPVKHLTTAEGGMLITKHAELAERISSKRAFGVDRVVGQREAPGVYDVPSLGFNYRMNEIEAAIGVEQLRKVEGFLARRKDNYEFLAAGLQKIDELTLFKSSYGDFQSSYYCLSVLLPETWCDKRIDIVKALNSRGVGTSVYYPKPVPYLGYYREKYGHEDGSFPNALRISNSSIAMPVGPHLDLVDMSYIIEAMEKTIQEVK